MDKRILKAAMAVAAALVLTACSEAPKSAAADAKAPTEAIKKPAKPSEPVAAKTAFYEMYKPARGWATDLLPLTLTSNEVPGVQSGDGKYPMWTAVFVSPSRREARTFFYSVADHGDNIHQGVSSGGAQVWTGATQKSQPFQITGFSVDSDDAYKTAMEKAGPWVKKNRDKKPSLFLASSSRFPAPVWYVLWGNTKSGYMVFVNATTGSTMTGK
jgi:hypothetical protein